MSEADFSRGRRKFRRISAQVLASTVKNLLMFNNGLCYGLPTIVIATLGGIANEHNSNEFLSMTPIQATWMGCIPFIAKPFGCLMSPIIADSLGRKRAMIIVNSPYAIGWFLLCRATTIWEIYVGSAMHGFAIGLVGSPVYAYVGEICEASTRSALSGYMFICLSFGMFIINVLNTCMPWRTAALFCSTVPVISAIAICFIPETPQWLLSKDRVREAEKSLCWLRGWVPREVVADEFNKLMEHNGRSVSCNTCLKQNLKCSHARQTFTEKLFELKRKSNRKPFLIILSMFFLTNFTGDFSMRPFLAQIFKAYESPIPPDQILAITGFAINCADVIFTSLVHFTGKRRLYLTMGTGIFLSSLVIAGYGFIYLPSGYNSFDQNHRSFHLENKNPTYIPLVCLSLWGFFSYCGFTAMPSMLLTELFPFKIRGMASGTAIGMNFFMGFISRKTYYDLETTLSLPGVSLLYSVICGVGLILIYLILPETENQTLEDIELYFSDKSKKFTDRKIKKSQKSTKNYNTNETDIWREGKTQGQTEDEKFEILDVE